MDKRHELFQRFVEANELSDMMDFRAKQRRYSGLGYHSIAIEEFMETIEFVGFVDGYERHPHRFKSPRGTADTGLKDRNTIDAMQEVLSGYFTEERVKNFAKMGLEIDTQYRGPMESRSHSSPTKYDTQYVLGNSLNGVV